MEQAPGPAAPVATPRLRLAAIDGDLGIMTRRLARLGVGLGLSGILLLTPASSRAQAPRMHSRLVDTLRTPPPSVMNGVATPASRMARYHQLGGGAGPEPGFTNGYSYDQPFWVAGGGSDPALSPISRVRVLNRYYGRGGWGLDPYGRAVPLPGRIGFLTPANPGPTLSGGLNVGLPY